jgi:DNA/RNA-binding domain of Phe-tRNA-synthetase-like protein
MTTMLFVSETWKAAYPGAAAGLLAMRDVANPEGHAALDQRKEALEAELRARFSGYDRSALRELPILQAYYNYYKRFEKTYHVQLQLESLVFKGKSIPRVAALVECMFMSELKNLLLTAGHDTDSLELPLRLEVADGSQRYTLYNGQEQALKPGDMYIADGKGVISSVIYGPDQRTRIRPETRRVLFTVYAPPGVGEALVWEHLHDIEANVRLVTQEAKTEAIQVYTA